MANFSRCIYNMRLNYICIFIFLCFSGNLLSQSKISAGLYGAVMHARNSYTSDVEPPNNFKVTQTKVKQDGSRYKIINKSYTFSMGGRGRYDLTDDLMLQGGLYVRNFLSNQLFPSFISIPILARYYVYDMLPIRYYVEGGGALNLRNPLSSRSNVSGIPGMGTLSLGGSYKLSTTLILDVAASANYYFTREILPDFKQRDLGVEIGLNYYFHSYHYIKQNCPKVYH